jgi:mRNA interferase MazF
MKIERGDVFFADLSPVLGSEIGGLRYVVIVSNDELNEEASSNGGTVIVAPLSSNSMDVGAKNARAMMPADIPELSVFSYKILLYEIRSIDTKRLKSHIGRLSDETMTEFDQKLKYALGL